jgi:hypothetical protein
MVYNIGVQALVKVRAGEEVRVRVRIRVRIRVMIRIYL